MGAVFVRLAQPIFSADKTGGTMDALQRVVDAGDLHQWEASLR